jgi:hypothetical protein
MEKMMITACAKTMGHDDKSDIPMHDSKFNIGQKVKRKYDAKSKNPMLNLVQDVSWSVLKNSWVYEIAESEGCGTCWWDVLEEDLMPL